MSLFDSTPTCFLIGFLSLALFLALYPVNRAVAFTPSVEGKKILLMDGGEAAPDVAIDGLLVGGPMIMYRPCEQENLDKFVANSKKKGWGRLTDNFWVCWSYAGEPGTFDWFDDMSMIVRNFRMAADAAKKAGFKGLAFDSELYAGVALFRYDEGLKYFESKTLEEYQDQAFQRGAEIMRAVNETYPDITLFFLFAGEPSEEDPTRYRGLLGPFIDGFLSECGPEATVVDGNESSYYSTSEADLMAHRKRILEAKLVCSRVPEAYQEHLEVGFGIWPDANNKAGMSFDIETFENNYRTPDELAYTLHQALRYTDEYVWLWRGDIQWLNKTVSVIDDQGKFVKKPLPEPYVEALQRARDPNLSLPTPRGYHAAKDGMRGFIEASDLPGWSDEETFGDLWDEFDHLMDLPLEWRFQLDQKNKGVENGWHTAEFDDSEWPHIEIRQFWERQGYNYRHYDGTAWYRTEIEVPELSEDQGLYLAFGAVNDDATVYVDGQRLPIVEVGRKGKRFLVDATDVLQPDHVHQIAVKVAEENGLGGIWKNVKLIQRNLR